MRKTSQLTPEAQNVYDFFENIGVDIRLKEEVVVTSYSNWR